MAQLPDPNFRDKHKAPLYMFDGRWCQFKQDHVDLEWGQRFDAGIGYRVYIRFKDAAVCNVFLPDQARTAANDLMMQHQPDEHARIINAALLEMATVTEPLNNAWAAAGCPDEPLDKQEGAGNA